MPTSANLITYDFIFSDATPLEPSEIANLKEATRAACRFWDYFCEPKYHVVLRVGCYREVWSRTIARVWEPKFLPTVAVGQIEFNSRYLASFRLYEASSIIAHQIGHLLGFGFGNWFQIFDTTTRKARRKFLAKQDNYFQISLRHMLIEEESDSGTRWSHWDEGRHGNELMTGLRNNGSEHVLESTIHMLELFGHRLKSQPNWPNQRIDWMDVLAQIPLGWDSAQEDPMAKVRANQVKTGITNLTLDQPFESVESRYWSPSVQ